MVGDILKTRVMVKKAMKDYKGDKVCTVSSTLSIWQGPIWTAVIGGVRPLFIVGP